tara:strand:+ start:16369 stop:16782 length:414 start_codon:yes stop_codon:yes gene_type:complete
MSENNFWRYINKNMRGIGIFTRIENSFFKGIPDINFLIDGKEGWIELKYRDKFPVRNNTPIKLHHFTKEQKLWHDNRVKNGGRTFLFVKVEKTYYLFKGKNIQFVGTMNKEEMENKSCKTWLNKINFKEFVRELCKN